MSSASSHKTLDNTNLPNRSVDITTQNDTQESALDTGPNGARPSLEGRATTAVLSTPHDAVLAELLGHRPDVSTSAKIDAVKSDVPSLPSQAQARLSSLASGVTEGADAASVAPSGAAGDSTAAAQTLRSAAASPIPATSPADHENLYDPFTGAQVGVLLPLNQPTNPPNSTQSQSAQNRVTEGESVQFEQAKDDLWSHLSRIRDLQSEIASMHVQMEGIGQSESVKRPGANPVHTDTIVVGEEWGTAEDPEEEEKVRKKARDEEFMTLAEAFEGRRSAIQGIMSKLDHLSKALTTFHSLPTPQIDLSSNNSRASTRDIISSPILRSPSPIFSNPMGTISPPPSSPVLSPTTGPSMNILTTDFGSGPNTKIDTPFSESPVDELHPKAELVTTGLGAVPSGKRTTLTSP